MKKFHYLCTLLWGNFKLYCYWLYKGNKENANAIAYDAGTFVAAYRKGKL